MSKNTFIYTNRQYNLCIQARAGSGKTTLALQIALNNPDLEILLLLYNRHLKEETKVRVVDAEIENMEVHTIHSYCCKYVAFGCRDDFGIIKNLEKKDKNKKFYDIIIVDEGQDLTELYYKVILKICAKNEGSKLYILGDVLQTIYQFNGADNKYIKNVVKYFDNGFDWKIVKFYRSHRITSKISEFINRVCYGKDNEEDYLITSKKEGVDVKYLICNLFGDKFVGCIINCCKLYGAGNVFVLAASVGSKVVKDIAYKLTKCKIPVHYPGEYDTELDGESILKGKVVFSSFHQCKGLERDCVIVVGFDNSYFLFYKKDKLMGGENYVCPNELYVACTRAKKELVLIHGNTNDYLPFIDVGVLEKCCKIEKLDEMKIRVRDNVRKCFSVSSLIKHLGTLFVVELMEMVKYKVVNEADELVKICKRIGNKWDEMGGKKGEKNIGDEAVSDITGIAIPAWYEYLTTGKIKINKYNMKIENIADVTKISARHIAEGMGLLCRYKQLSRFDWIEEDDMEYCIERMRGKISENAEYEYNVVLSTSMYDINGYIDCIDTGEYIWEFKCVSELKFEHLLQLIIYSFMFMRTYKYKIGSEVGIEGMKGRYKIVDIDNLNARVVEIDGKKNRGDEFDVDIEDLKCIRGMYLYNILDDCLWKVCMSFKEMKQVVEKLLVYKYGTGLIKK